MSEIAPLHSASQNKENSGDTPFVTSSIQATSNVIIANGYDPFDECVEEVVIDEGIVFKFRACGVFRWLIIELFVQLTLTAT